MTSQHVTGLFDLPAEVRAEIWRHCVDFGLNRHPTEDGLAKYTPSLSLLRTCRQVYGEAHGELVRSNVFIKISTPWPNTREYIESQGHVPILLSGNRAEDFLPVHLDCQLRAPMLQEISRTDINYIIIYEEDLPAFCRLWWYTELTHDHPNNFMQLRLKISTPAVSSDHKAPVRQSRTAQKRLLDPFVNVKRLASFVVDGEVDPDIKLDFMTRNQVPYESAESCIERALALKEQGNKLLALSKPREAISSFEDSFRAMFVIVNGRQRDEWGESHFDTKLKSGPFKDQSGNYARLTIRIELVAQTVMAYYCLQDYETAVFWGKRSIDMARLQFGDTVDMPLLDFDATGNWARVYFSTALASRESGRIVEALELYRIARLKLPGDAKVLAEASGFDRAKNAYMTGVQRAASA